MNAAEVTWDLASFATAACMSTAARPPSHPRTGAGGNHHDLGLFGVGSAGGPKSRGAIGLYHLAWQLDSIDELVAARQTLLDAGAKVTLRLGCFRLRSGLLSHSVAIAERLL
jgi:hypothetical protein